MAFEKIDKEYVLSDSSENAYGYKLLTSGYVQDEFLKNPIGYYMHKKDDGVLVKWYDLKLEGDKIVGKPMINMEHPRGARTVTEIVDGFLNAASMGKLKFLDFELADNPSDPENPMLVVTKWYNRECSLVDIPANGNAVKPELCDADDNDINLADLTENLKIKLNKMKTVQLPINDKLLSTLNLKDGEVTPEAVMEAVEGLKTENETLTTKVEKAEKELSDERKTVNSDKIKSTLDKAQQEGRINGATRKRLETQFADKPTELADLIKDMPQYQSVTERMDNEDGGAVKHLVSKSYEELDLANELEDLKEKAPEVFKQKYKQRFGKDYKG
jgi:hypothetical protein